jgi:hypothetical protein
MLSNLSMDRRSRHRVGWFSTYLKVCASSLPTPSELVRRSRYVAGSKTRKSITRRSPLVDPDRGPISRYRCWRMSGPSDRIAPRLMRGGGTYKTELWIRDRLWGVSRSVGFSWHPVNEPGRAGRSPKLQLMQLMIFTDPTSRTPDIWIVQMGLVVCATIDRKAALIEHQSYVLGEKTIRSATRPIEEMDPKSRVVLPYRCRPDQSGFDIDPRPLRSGATYTYELRIRDRFGRVSRPIGFSWRPANP